MYNVLTTEQGVTKGGCMFLSMRMNTNPKKDTSRKGNMFNAEASWSTGKCVAIAATMPIKPRSAFHPSISYSTSENKTLLPDVPTFNIIFPVATPSHLF